MAGPGDELPAAGAGRRRLRVSHADREQVIDTLKAAFVQGMLAKDEFDLRVGQALAARTGAELSVLTADIPAPLTKAPPPTPALVPPPPTVVTDIKTAARMIATATAIPAGLWAFAVFAPGKDVDKGGLSLLVLAPTFIWLIFLLLVAVDMLTARHEKRSGEQAPPRRSDAGGAQAPPRAASAASGGRQPTRPSHRRELEGRPGRTGCGRLVRGAFGMPAGRP